MPDTPVSKSSRSTGCLVVTGGGTGGHLFPALAIIDTLQATHPDLEIAYLGHPFKIEGHRVPERGLPFYPLEFSGMPRKLSISFIGWCVQFFKATQTARQTLRQLKPNAVFATGGFITAPVLLAAKTLGIPTILHEPDAYPGLVNRWFSRWASALTVAFEAAGQYLKGPHPLVTGNPLRLGTKQLTKPEACAVLELPFDLQKPIILVMGGSSGAQHINQAVLEALPALIDSMGVQIIHQVGPTLYEAHMNACPQHYREHPCYQPRAFINEMTAAMSIATVAVCRSGSMTLSELTGAGLPSILIPYPYAAANHQWHNAQALVSAGAAWVIADKELSAERLAETLGLLLANPDTLHAMQQATQPLARPYASQTIAQVILSYLPTAEPPTRSDSRDGLLQATES